jgi:hypothetical protein
VPTALITFGSHPVPFIDDRAVRPREQAADAAEPDLGEFKKQFS